MAGDLMSNMPFAEYAELDAVNWSTLKELRKSPLHYQHRLKVSRKDTARLALGRGAHTAVFEPDRFMQEYACFKGPIRRGAKWDAFKEAHVDETILKRDEYEMCLAMRDAVRSHPVAAEYLQRGRGEQTIQWTNAETGLACKGRVDWISESNPALVDLKTTGDVEMGKFMSLSARMAYHCQGAFYRDGLTQVLGTELPVVIIAVEAAAPHDVAVYRYDEDALYAGMEEVLQLLQTVVACRQVKRWVGRYQKEQVLRLPTWLTGIDEEDATGLDLIVNGHGATAEGG